MGRKWWEKWIGDTCFYCGFFGAGDVRVGVSIGNKEGSIDLLIFTVGFMR
ncbi:hypothetical protein WKH56_19960 [Priestia sp. SB1]